MVWEDIRSHSRSVGARSVAWPVVAAAITHPNAPRRARSTRRATAATKLLRYGPSWTAGIVALGLSVWMAFRQGGYFPDSYLAAGAVAFAAVGVLFLLVAPSFALSSRGLIGLASLAGLTAWTALSSNWSATPQVALEYAQRDLTCVGLFVLALIAAGSGRYARQLVWGTLIAIAVIVGAGLLSRLYPDLVPGELPVLFGVPQYRLSYPLGYWNAYGALAGIGTVLAVGLAADIRSAVWMRALSAGGAVSMGTATYLSLSRGADLAVLAGLLVLALLAVRRATLLLIGGAIAVGVGAAVSLIQAHRVLLDAPGSALARERAGHTVGAALTVVVLAVMAATAVVALGRSTPALQRIARRSVPALKIGALVAGVCLVLVGIVRAHDVSRGVSRGADFVSRQADDFWNPTTGAPPPGAARLTSAQSTRSDLYRIAFDGFTAHPLIGDGAAGFRVRFLRERQSYESVLNAHSLEVETIGELGIVGIALLLVFLGSIVAGAVHTRVNSRGGLGRSQGAAVSGACTVWIVHGAFDWDWQMTAVTGVALILAATLFPMGSVRRRGLGRHGRGDPQGAPAVSAAGASPSGEQQ